MKHVDAVKGDMVLESVLMGWESPCPGQGSSICWLREVRSSLEVEKSLGKILSFLQMEGNQLAVSCRP